MVKKKTPAQYGAAKKKREKNPRKEDSISAYTYLWSIRHRNSQPSIIMLCP